MIGTSVSRYAPMRVKCSQRCSRASRCSSSARVVDSVAVTRGAYSSEHTRFQRVLLDAVVAADDAVGSRTLAGGDNRLELGAREVQSDQIVSRVAAGKPSVGDELAVDRPPSLLAVVVGTEAAAEEAETAVERAELRPERIGDSR